MRDDTSHGTNDIVLGFTKNAVSDGYAGCAAGNDVLVKYQGVTSDWKVTRHEFAHLYGNDDVSSSAANHPVDIMENLYSHPNTWCDTAAYHHWQNMSNNRDKYD